MQLFISQISCSPTSFHALGSNNQCFFLVRFKRIYPILNEPSPFSLSRDFGAVHVLEQCVLKNSIINGAPLLFMRSTLVSGGVNIADSRVKEVSSCDDGFRGSGVVGFWSG